MASPVVVTRIQNRRGRQSQFDALYPPGYNGVGGFNSSPGFTLANYPGVLASGEMAMCTDSRRLFMGNINGEYIELAAAVPPLPPTPEAPPLVLVLPPAASFTLIPALTYAATPFTKLQYDITDAPGPNWNIIGTTFSRNGVLEITSVEYFAPIPNLPNPPITATALTDTGTEVNTTTNELTFRADINPASTLIEISYKHNFPGNLTFSSSSINWVAF